MVVPGALVVDCIVDWSPGVTCAVVLGEITSVVVVDVTADVGVEATVVDCTVGAPVVDNIDVEGGIAASVVIPDTPVENGVVVEATVVGGTVDVRIIDGVSDVGSIVVVEMKVVVDLFVSGSLVLNDVCTAEDVLG
jgi:hypothetical protein